mmetsp:Transcript_109129/g.250322  ORF Transcript_109129/g.250322 Transcript_109129/m.250322 type:complete len:244 (+) Transcript_109129:1717-2448(+)
MPSGVQQGDNHGHVPALGGQHQGRLAPDVPGVQSVAIFGQKIDNLQIAHHTSQVKRGVPIAVRVHLKRVNLVQFVHSVHIPAPHGVVQGGSALRVLKPHDRKRVLAHCDELGQQHHQQVVFHGVDEHVPPSLVDGEQGGVVLQDHIEDFFVLAIHGQHNRRLAHGVEIVHVRPTPQEALKQQSVLPHNRNVDCRVHPGIVVVDVGLGFQQQIHHLVMPLVCSEQQRSPAQGVLTRLYVGFGRN